MLQNWLLLLLKLAITQDQADRSAAIEMAAELDSCTKSPTFGYFSRTNREVCDAITQGGTDHSKAPLLRYASQIENLRLRRAFLGAVGISEQHPTKPSRSTVRRMPSTDLWRGLP